MLTSEWLGHVSYEPTIERLERQRERVLAGEDAQHVFFCEHEPVITVGRSGDVAHVLANDIQVVHASRGGDVTYHGPGQLMIYPVIRLRTGVVSFLETVAGALGDVLAHYGVSGARWRREPPGVWLDGAKIAACGIHLRRGVTLHGFALNVSTPPKVWQRIVPCGLHDMRVTSLAAQLADREAPSVERVSQIIAPLIIRALSEPRPGRTINDSR